MTKEEKQRDLHLLYIHLMKQHLQTIEESVMDGNHNITYHTTAYLRRLAQRIERATKDR
jgi:hypothetical protein